MSIIGFFNGASSRCFQQLRRWSRDYVEGNPQTEANIKLTYKRIRGKASQERISRLAQAERTEAERVVIHDKLQAESPAEHIRKAWKSRNTA